MSFKNNAILYEDDGTEVIINLEAMSDKELFEVLHIVIHIIENRNRAMRIKE